MAVSTQIKAKLETAKTVTHAGVTGAFLAIGTPLSAPAQCLIITSTLSASSVAVTAWLSLDGTNNQIMVVGGSSLVIDVSGNKQGTGSLSFAKGEQFYVKEGQDGAPDAGDISITTIYARV